MTFFFTQVPETSRFASARTAGRSRGDGQLMVGNKFLSVYLDSFETTGRWHRSAIARGAPTQAPRVSLGPTGPKGVIFLDIYATATVLRQRF